MLAVPGKNDLRIPSANELTVTCILKLRVRLSYTGWNMATSGLLLAAKTKEVHQQLQKLFEKRKVKKRYTALLEGEQIPAHGTISLPLCLTRLDRPRRMVELGAWKRSCYALSNAGI